MPTVKHKTPGKVRIIGGHWRGTVLSVATRATLRPSADRLRETLFNWLKGHIVGLRCLDLCSGSGALGLEALSRGAAEVVCVEKHRATARQLQQQIDTLSATEHATVICMDAYRWIPKARQSFQLCFLDPPFNDPRRHEYPMLIARHKLVEKGALVYWESPRSDTQQCPDHWTIYKQTQTAAVRATLYAVNTTQAVS